MGLQIHTKQRVCIQLFNHRQNVCIELWYFISI